MADRRSGRIVAAWSPMAKVRVYDWRFSSEKREAEVLATVRSLARMNAGRRLFVAIAPRGDSLFTCYEFRAALVAAVFEEGEVRHG